MVENEETTVRALVCILKTLSKQL